MGIFLYTIFLFKLIASLIYYYIKSRKKIFKKDIQVATNVVSFLFISIILLVIFFIGSFIIDVYYNSKFGYNFVSYFILNMFSHPLFLSIPTSLSNIVNYININVPQFDQKLKIFRDIFPEFLIIFPLLGFLYLIVKTFDVLIKKYQLIPEKILNFFLVDYKKPNTYKISVLYYPYLYVIPGIVLIFFSLYSLIIYSYSEQLLYYLSGGISSVNLGNQTFIQILYNISNNIPGFIQQCLLAPFHLSYPLYEFSYVVVYLIGIGFIQGYIHSLKQTTLEEQFVDNIQNAPITKIELPPASLNQYLKKIYETYSNTNHSNGSQLNHQLKKDILSPLFELDPIPGTEPILEDGPPRFNILGLNERYPDTVETERYKYLNKPEDFHLIWKRILKILNLDIFYVIQTKVLENLFHNRNVILSTESLSGKTSIMLAAILHEIIQKKRTVLIIVAHDSVADEFNYLLRLYFENEPWYLSIHKLTLTSIDNKRFQENISDRKPDIIFITPFMIHEEILNHPKAYKRFLENLGLICIPDLHYLDGYEFIQSSIICKRLFFLIKTITDKAKIRQKEIVEINQNVFITLNPIENALEVCKSFCGRFVNLTELSEIRDSQAPTSYKRIFGFRATQNEDSAESFKLLPFTLAHMALTMRIKPVILLGFRGRISESDKARAAAQLEDSDLNRSEIEKNIFIEDDFIKYREKIIYKYPIASLMESPLIIVSGENDRLINFSHLFRSIGMLSPHREVLILGIVTNEESEFNFRYVAEFWQDSINKKKDRYRYRKLKPIPKYDEDIKTLIQNHVLWMVRDKFSYEESMGRSGIFIHEIMDSLQINNELLNEIIENLEKEQKIKKIEKKEYFNNRRKISFLGYTYISTEPFEKLNLRTQDPYNCIPVRDESNGKILIKIDEFERKTFFYPGTTHSINEERYIILSSSPNEILVKPNHSLIESRIHFEVLNQDQIKEILLNKNTLFTHKIYTIKKYGNLKIQTFTSGQKNKLLSHKSELAEDGKLDKQESNKSDKQESNRIQIDLRPSMIVHRNPFSNEILSIEDLTNNLNLDESYKIQEKLDLFALFIEQENLNSEEINHDHDLLLEFEEKIYSALELLIDNPRNLLIICSNYEIINNKSGIIVYFISRALYNTNIFDIIERDISLVNTNETSIIFDYLINLGFNLKIIQEFMSKFKQGSN